MPDAARPPTRRVTLEEVARVAGVSRATVSRVVNGVASVDQNIRQAVERAITTTGYQPNLAARSLVTRRANAVALVLPDGDDVLGDPFFGRVLTGVLGALSATSTHLVLVKIGPGGRERIVADLRGGRLDGAILVHTNHNDPLARQLTAARFPVVLWGRPPRPMPITHVDVNQATGCALAAGHLVALGRNRIATITGRLDTPAGEDRLTGFRSALASLGRELVSVEGAFTRESGRSAMHRLLAEHPDIDAVFIASDLMAHGALPVLRRHGRAVPADVAVVGFDDSSAAVHCDPPLTTVRQPVEDMAAELTRQLLRHINDPAAPRNTVIFEPTLVVRQSAPHGETSTSSVDVANGGLLDQSGG
ncbi:MAG TPA: LacI family DNA-binding transcriptional regulator [Actinophytocola sp.]|uniref:LacI family DNA-binding transcriptional regulator n=1 Tax=Actinophytocola sp. TaxID=1872138 RepID=UPI002DB580DF|nr:LacI family DNA-binding transcriptional regulator [Actinophytocola sp.]HEU5473380.1 LacI family DNA-binding transcriptional regulator [Actinophytocola sp.]